MSFLTVEMGSGRKRAPSPPMPDQLVHRDDVTFAQKQRLAMMAKMGVGPISSPSGGRPSSVLPGAEYGREPPRVDKRAELLAKERRFREQQERQEEAEEENLGFEPFPKKKPAPKAASSMVRLGPVMPREDIPKVLPTPAPAPPPPPERAFLGGVAAGPKPELKLELKISKETADRARRASTDEAGGGEHESEDEDDKAKAERKKRPLPQPEQAQKGNKKKAKKKGRGDEEFEEWQGEEEEWEEDEPSHEAWQQQDRKPPRDATPKPQMVVESVKGKVSTANKNYTDADLQRRFQMFGADDSQGGSLMTEEQVLRMIRREKQERGIGGSTGTNPGAAARRVQRELDEWEKAKEQQRARVKSPRRFERMVVARK